MSTTNPYSQYVTYEVPNGLDETGGMYAYTQVQQVNPQWQAYETAQAQPFAGAPDLSSRYDNPWAIDATAFHSAVDPMLRNNSWSSPEGQNGNVYLPLLGGKTWTPSGANSYIQYHPAGEMIGAWDPGPDDNPNSGSPGVANPYAYYDISGDMSAILGQPGSNVHANVKYVEQNGQLVPVADPATWNWTNSGSFGNLLRGLGPIPNIALAIATGGLSLPEQLAANAALSLAKGASLADVLKNAVTGYAASGITGLDSVKDIAGQLSAIDPSLGSAFNSAVVGGTRAALSGGDVLQSALTAGATGGVNAAIKELSASIPGAENWTPQQQQLFSNAATSLLSGKSINKVALDAALAAGKQAITESNNAYAMDSMGNALAADQTPATSTPAAPATAGGLNINALLALLSANQANSTLQNIQAVQTPGVDIKYYVDPFSTLENLNGVSASSGGSIDDLIRLTRS